MNREPEADRLAEESAQPDDIEILEIVGVNESADDVPADEEVVIAFDEEPADRPVAPAQSPARDGADGDLAETRERLLRLRADFENLKKRIEREREEYFRHATASLVARLLPVLDNFERALAAARQAGSTDSFFEGVALIQRQLLDEMRREGLRTVECLGRPFDPTLHEAVATEANPRLPANTVVEEMQRGYYFDDRLLRPALVRVTVHGRTDERRGPDAKEPSDG